jgi:hypothetical protein
METTPIIEEMVTPLQNKTVTADGKGEGISVHKGGDVVTSFVENLLHNYKAAQKGGAEGKVVSVEDLINWQCADNMGLSKDFLNKNGHLAQLLKGKKTDLLPIAIKDNTSGVVVNTFARLSLVQNKKTGEVTFKTNLLRPEVDLSQYCGYKFTDEDKANLQKTGNLGKVISVKFKNEDAPKSIYLSWDKQTNELIAIDASKVKIPTTILGKTLTPEQQQILKEGKAVKIDGMKSAVGKEFSNTLQFSTLEKRFVFIGEGRKIPHKLGGVTLTDEQFDKLGKGEVVQIMNLRDKKGNPYNSYVRWNAKDEKLDFSNYAEFKKKEIAPTLEHTTQVAANNDGHKPEALKNVKGAVEQKQPTTPTTQQKQEQKENVAKSSVKKPKVKSKLKL